MRSINISDDIQAILTQYAASIPDAYVGAPSGELYITPSDEDACREDGEIALFDICIGLDDATEEVVGEIILFDDFTAIFEFLEDNDDLLQIQ